jgi:hypothetical protein
MHSFARLRQLTPPDRQTLLSALVLLPLVSLMLRLGGMSRVHAAIARQLRRSGHRPGDPCPTARMVSIAARRGPWRPACLSTALTLQWLLARRGISTELRLGVRRASAGIEAHAWVEHAGVALLEPSAHERFRAFDALHATRGNP